MWHIIHISHKLTAQLCSIQTAKKNNNFINPSSANGIYACHGVYDDHRYFTVFIKNIFWIDSSKTKTKVKKQMAVEGLKSRKFSYIMIFSVALPQHNYSKINNTCDKKKV